MDIGMLFEKIVKKVWGEPKTSVYFAGYYNANLGYKSILYTICVYLLNYEIVSQDEKQVLSEYISRDEENYLSDEKSEELMEWFKNKYKL